MKQKFTFSEKEKFDKILKNKKEETQIEKDFYKKTEKYLKFIKWIPGLKMIWVWNSISMNSASKNSDIDLLIVTSNNSMWFVRILVTFIFQILWVRKNEKNHSWRFCLSFFCTIDWLDFSQFALKKDPYLYFWILYFKPILDYKNTYNLFLEKNKNWADFEEYKNILEKNKKYIKFSKNSHIIPFNKGDEDIIKLNNLRAEGFSPLRIVNNICKKIFLPKTIKTYNKIWKPYWVIINENMLKFHNWDIRKEIAKNF